MGRKPGASQAIVGHVWVRHDHFVMNRLTTYHADVRCAHLRPRRPPPIKEVKLSEVKKTFPGATPCKTCFP